MSIAGRTGARYYHYQPYVDGFAAYDYPWYDAIPDPTDKIDEEIREDIPRQIVWSPFVELEDVNVEVGAGTARLTGASEQPQGGRCGGRKCLRRWGGVGGERTGGAVNCPPSARLTASLLDGAHRTELRFYPAARRLQDDLLGFPLEGFRPDGDFRHIRGAPQLPRI